MSRPAAAITMNYTVAYILLFESAGLSKGKSLLVHSVGGGVGQAIVQLARTVPDVTIFGVCSKSKHEALKANNSPIDHLLERGSDYCSEVRKVQPDGVDILLDYLCGEDCSRDYSLLKPMGKYILYGSSNVVTGKTKSFFSAARSWWQVDKVSPIKLFEENRTLFGVNLRRLMYQQSGCDIVRRAIENIFTLVNQTSLGLDVAEAMQKMHDRKNIGMIILDPSLEPKPKQLRQPRVRRKIRRSNRPKSKRTAKRRKRMTMKKKRKIDKH